MFGSAGRGDKGQKSRFKGSRPVPALDKAVKYNKYRLLYQTYPKGGWIDRIQTA